MSEVQTQRIAIVGAGELGRQIVHLGQKNGYSIVGFFDDWVGCEGTIVSGLPVFGKLADIDKNVSCFDALVLAIGYKHFDSRKSIYEDLSARYEFASIIDSSAIVDPTAVIAPGCVIYPNVVLDKEVRICENVLLNLSDNICHNSVIGAHSYVSPGVNCAGYVNVGEMCFLGIGATVMDSVSICGKSVVGAQSLVVRDITETGTYVGIPARRIEPRHGL